MAHRSAFQPLKGSGRKMPPSMTVSPAFMLRVMSPRRCTLMQRGVAPGGTSSGISCGGGVVWGWGRVCVVRNSRCCQDSKGTSGEIMEDWGGL
jgi:hypothetical protein